MRMRAPHGLPLRLSPERHPGRDTRGHLGEAQWPRLAHHRQVKELASEALPGADGGPAQLLHVRTCKA